ncbi:MAG: ABC transporter permease [Phycisphaerales bacterium]
MSAFRAIQDKASELGRTRVFRVSVAVVMSVAVAIVALASYREAARLYRLSERVPEILAEASLKPANAIANELVQGGTVTIDGVTVGDPVLARRLEMMFTPDGRLEKIGEAASLLIATERPEWLPVPIAQEPALALAGAAVAIAVILAACLTGIALQLVVVSVVSAVLGALTLLVSTSHLAASIAAIPLLLFGFSLAVSLVLAALDRPNPMCAVAATVVRESMRLRIAVAFAALAVIVIPLLPQAIDPATPLRYQVQTFLSRALDTMYIVCAFLTVFLGCATVAFEIRDRQAWTTLTKPVNRRAWLAGKWLGIVALNACVLLTCTVAMYAFLAQVRSRPPQDIFDAMAVGEEVLVAREGGTPDYERLSREALDGEIDARMKADPNIQADLREKVRSEVEIRRALAKGILEEYGKSQRTIPPNEERIYRFSGLSEQRRLGGTLTLRYKFYSGESDPHAMYPIIFLFGSGDGQQWIDHSFTAAQWNIVLVPAESIAPDGTLEIRIQNLQYNRNAGPGDPPFLPGRYHIAFDRDGLELLYRVGGFADNLLRAQLMNLCKLSFLAMLSVVCASVLSFPVACLIVFTVLAAGSTGSFLATSIDEYYYRTDQVGVKIFEAIVKSIATATEFALRSFTEARANGPLVEGRDVPWFAVWRTYLLIGVAWSGALFALGSWLFGRKELAIYSGQGG